MCFDPPEEVVRSCKKSGKVSKSRRTLYEIIETRENSSKLVKTRQNSLKLLKTGQNDAKPLKMVIGENYYIINLTKLAKNRKKISSFLNKILTVEDGAKECNV